MGKSARHKLASLATLFCLSALVRAELPKVAYEQVWPDASFHDTCVPLRVEITNSEDNTVGVLTARSLFGAIAYPVELPKGATKVVDVYFRGTGWSDSESLELKTPLGTKRVEVEIKGTNRPGQRYVGVISQTLGLLSSLRQIKNGRTQFWDTSCKPEFAPVRSVGYAGLSLVVLYEGAERLSDDAVAALKRYVLGGGQLLFIGGPSAPWLRDERWQGFLPVSPLTPTVINDPQFTAPSPRRLVGQLSVMQSKVLPGGRTVATHRGTTIMVEQDIGLGRCTFWAFDPFSEPLRTWAGRDDLIRRVTPDNTQVADFLGIGYQEDPHNPGIPVQRASSNPFKTEVPAAGQIALILFGFLFTVIPVNFFILQRINRRELAWLTIPVISIGFSGLVFMSASSLYSARGARLNHGVAIADESVSEVLYLGGQDLFIPRGGTYDLGLHGVEYAENRSREFSMLGRRSDGLGDSSELLDIGQVVAPAFKASNLTFRSLEFVQAIPLDGRLLFAPVLKRVKDGWTLKGSLTNETRLSLTNVLLSYQGFACKIKDVQPRSTQQVSAFIREGDLQFWMGQSPPPVGSSLALVATAEGLPVGSNLGAEPEDKKGCRFVYTWRQK